MALRNSIQNIFFCSNREGAVLAGPLRGDARVDLCPIACGFPSELVGLEQIGKAWIIGGNESQLSATIRPAKHKAGKPALARISHVGSSTRPIGAIRIILLKKKRGDYIVTVTSCPLLDLPGRSRLIDRTITSVQFR